MNRDTKEIFKLIGKDLNENTYFLKTKILILKI